MADEKNTIPTCSSEGDVLYKYRSMAMPDTAAHTLDILRNWYLFCPSPSSFNDPFECQVNMSFEAPSGVKNERAIKQIMKENPNITASEAERIAPERWRQVEERGFKDALRWIRDDTGVISFSEINDDILMWSHYAGGHNGICFEFRCTDEKHIDFFELARRVHYQNELPKPNFYTTHPIEKANALILTKSIHWSYEREWRIIILPDAISKSRYVLVPSGVITSIYFGCKMTDKNRDAVMQILQRAQNKGVRVFQAKRQTDAYGLFFEPVRDE